MRLKNMIFAGGAIVTMFFTGKLIGHIECLINIRNKYREDIDDIIDKHGEIADDINKYCCFTIKKKETTAKGE